MEKAPEISPSKNPLFDELESLAIEFPGNPKDEKTCILERQTQFEKQLSELSVRQVSIPRNNSFSDEFYF